MVYVSGAVMQPGVYQLAPGSRVKDALEAAGGPASKAELEWLNLAAHLEDGDQIWVPQTGENPASSPARSPTGEPGWKLVNLNTATVELLEELPGIGPVTAEKILVYREEHGPFQSIEEIQNVSGIGPATFERIKDLITVGPTP
jgi:competence protein ComEA